MIQRCFGSVFTATAGIDCGDFEDEVVVVEVARRPGFAPDVVAATEGVDDIRPAEGGGLRRGEAYARVAGELHAQLAVAGGVAGVGFGEHLNARDDRPGRHGEPEVAVALFVVREGGGVHVVAGEGVFRVGPIAGRRRSGRRLEPAVRDLLIEDVELNVV